MFLGIEIGGSKLQIGLGPGDGTLAWLYRGDVNPAAAADGIREHITAALPRLLQDAGIARSALRGAGIGFGGPVDDHTRTVIKSHQIPGWDNFPLAAWLADQLGIPTTLGNDADVAGLAEALFGAGAACGLARGPLFYITLGSGIGGGFIIDQKIYRGTGHGAAEIGHVLVNDPDNPARLVALEDIASGWSIAQRAQRLLGERRASPPPTSALGGLPTALLDLCGGNPTTLTTHHVAAAAAQNDPLAQSVLANAIDALALAIRQMITLLCPRRIVIGGGVALIGEDLLFKPLRQRLDAIMFPPFKDCYDIVPAALGEEVVVHGALALAARS
jgi:glucokinase